uniref:Disease resistance N-terminal domain-containing protein n=1 Tax=Nelumbo nucifera TaxID=4432 RepID=A0A822XQ97_NELNU|nr:TPA_asm: hypothetical protein HUJ06_022368 [Nelumbo nucifera]
MQMKDTCLKIFLREIRDVVYRATYTIDEFIYESHRQSLEDENNWSISRTGAGRKVHEYINFSFNKQQILHKYEIPSVKTDLTKELVEIEEEIKPNYLNLISSDKWELDEKERRLQAVSSLDKRQESISCVDESDVFGRGKDKKEMMKILLSDQ